ncbi:MAG: terpene cyclase/mutase family protein [Verrucomicrobia subdivision 3 bacterium]|nr:terpene cyclase/mutase family protein [Limisphaerales bacterium]
MNYQSDTRALPALAITLIALSLSMPSPASAQQAGGTRIGGVLKPDPTQSRRALRSTYGLRKNPLRNAKRSEIINELGGSAETEAAVVNALDWFTRTQKENGCWSETQSNVAHTGLVILCYFSYGVKPDDETNYGQALAKGLDWLVKQVPETGNMRDGGRMYGQAIGTLALGEAAGITRLEKYYQPLERAVSFLCASQNPKSGGWRYQPHPSLEHAGDLSVTGWVIMALRSAEMAGVSVPAKHLGPARQFLDTVSAGQHKGFYGYKDSVPKPSMTSVGMYCQQLYGSKPDEKRQIDSAKFLATRLPATTQKDYYYWYYGCLSLFLHGGKPWQDWNAKMKPLFLKKQQANGTWKPEGRRAKQEGTTITTAWATLSLTVYYRYLPMINGYTRQSAVNAKSGGSTFGIRKQRPGSERSNTTQNQ